MPPTLVSAADDLVQSIWLGEGYEGPNCGENVGSVALVLVQGYGGGNLALGYSGLRWFAADSASKSLKLWFVWPPTHPPAAEPALQIHEGHFGSGWTWSQPSVPLADFGSPLVQVGVGSLLVRSLICW